MSTDFAVCMSVVAVITAIGSLIISTITAREPGVPGPAGPPGMTGADGQCKCLSNGIGGTRDAKDAAIGGLASLNDTFKNQPYQLPPDVTVTDPYFDIVQRLRNWMSKGYSIGAIDPKAPIFSTEPGGLRLNNCRLVESKWRLK